MNPSNPIVRVMAAIVAVAVGLRLLVELLAPVALELTVGLVIAGLLNLLWLIRRRDRW